MEKPRISFETERLIVRSIEDADQEYYMDLRAETSELAAAYQTLPGFREKEWDTELNGTDDIYMAAFLKEDSTFVASCSFQNYVGDVLELGYDVVAEYRNRGIATELVNGMLVTAFSVFAGKPALIKTKSSNQACRRVAEKCGGEFKGYEETPAAKAIASMMQELREKDPEDETFKKLQKENEAFLEESKDGVCIYTFSAKNKTEQ